MSTEIRIPSPPEAEARRRGLGGAAIGGHLRRISERIDREANQVYARIGVDFEQRWMGVLDLLVLQGAMSVNELARGLGISHPAVSQTRGSLLAAGLVAERPDPADGRRRHLYLTGEGEALVQKLRPVWAALEQAGRDLDAEAGDAVAMLERLEAALERRSIGDRVAEALAGRETPRTADVPGADPPG